MDIDWSFIDRIKHIRSIHGLSQAQFAKRINVSSGNVGEWERGKSLPGFIALTAISTEFSVSTDWIIKGVEFSHSLSNEFLLLLNKLTNNEKFELEKYLRFLVWNIEEEKKKAALEEQPMVKETIYEYLPLIGRAAAGIPLLIDEMVHGYIPVEAENHQYTNCYLIEAIGDSMTDVGIEDGDLVIVRPQPAVDIGDITLVRIGDEATIKYFHKEQDVIYLKAANPKYAPLKFSVTDNIVIIGKVIKTLKKNVLNNMVIPESEECLEEYKKGLRVTVKNGVSPRPIKKAFILNPNGN